MRARLDVCAAGFADKVSYAVHGGVLLACGSPLREMPLFVVARVEGTTG